jgi:precorrin-8X/cobalt-precorrin-8 methylmutase
MSTGRVHPIEVESYRILHERVDLSGFPPGVAAVVARMIHASADPAYAASVITDEQAVTAGVAALRAGAPVVCDVTMVQAGISGTETHCLLAQATAGPGGSPTRSAQAIRLAAERWPEGAVFVVGCAPTALAEITDLVSSGALAPALVIGLPVGFVGAAESKARLVEVATGTPRGVPIVTNVGERGGAAVAAAAVNALVRLASGELA